VSGVFDTGAQQTIISDVVARHLGYNTHNSNDRFDRPVSIQWGDGSTIAVNQLTQLGNITALTLPQSQLHDNLVSVSDIVDIGNNTVTFSPTQAIVTNIYNKHTNSYPRDKSTGLCCLLSPSQASVDTVYNVEFKFVNIIASFLYGTLTMSTNATMF
jgi:hypothetical protein